MTLQYGGVSLATCLSKITYEVYIFPDFTITQHAQKMSDPRKFFKYSIVDMGFRVQIVKNKNVLP